MGIRFPYGTFVINMTACVIIGFTLTYMGKRADLDPSLRFLIPIGFIGAYSTFSTYEWETLSTLRSGAWALAALYAGALHESILNTLTGTGLIPGLNPDFKIDVAPQEPWNVLAGANIELTPRFAVTVEGGFGNRMQFVIMPGVRF